MGQKQRREDEWSEEDLSSVPGAPRGYGRGDRRYETDGNIQAIRKIENVYRGKDVCTACYGRPVVHMCLKTNSQIS